MVFNLSMFSSQKIVFLIILLILITSGGIFILKKQFSPQAKPQKQFIPPSNMKLLSPAFENNQYIPPQYTCDGQNINPLLQILEVPENAKSLVLIMDDPDAPLGNWVHWLVWNIDPKTKEIAPNSSPPLAIQGITSFGQAGYGGPCPPSGTHRYFFKLYALDVILDLSPHSNKTQLETAMKNHIIAKTELIGLYQRR